MGAAWLLHHRGVLGCLCVGRSLLRGYGAQLGRFWQSPALVVEHEPVLLHAGKAELLKCLKCFKLVARENLFDSCDL